MKQFLVVDVTPGVAPDAIHSIHSTREAAEKAMRQLALHCTAEDVTLDRALSWFEIREQDK